MNYLRAIGALGCMILCLVFRSSNAFISGALFTPALYLGIRCVIRIQYEFRMSERESK
jgi:hypothetical protein